MVRATVDVLIAIILDNLCLYSLSPIQYNDSLGMMSLPACNQLVSKITEKPGRYDRNIRKLMDDLNEKGCGIPKISCTCEQEVVIIDDKEYVTVGGYQYDDHSITLHAKDYNNAQELMETLQHELVHAWQGCNRDREKDSHDTCARGESPRRLAGGLDKTADGVRRVSLWLSHSPAKQGEGTMGCARSKPRSAFAPQGRAGNGVPASQPTQPVATRPLSIQKDGTWYSAPARHASQGSRSQVCSRLGGWLLKPHPAYGWDLTKNIWEAYTTTGYIGTAYTYSAYGQVSASGSITQPIQWSSEYNDTELGLVYYNYRHYNPADGRWIGRDVLSEIWEKVWDCAHFISRAGKIT